MVRVELLDDEEEVEVEEVVRGVEGAVELVTMESVLAPPLNRSLMKLSIGFCCRSHNAEARGARVGCSTMMVDCNEASECLQP